MGKLTDYTELTPFNDNMILVQRGSRMYVKKIIETADLDIYKKLIGKHCRNISEVFEIYEYEDRAIIIEEYINGTTLNDILLERVTLSEAEVKNIISQVCDGLEFLHSFGIVHRDINPNNIIITSDDIVKIIDFDISRFVKENASSDTAILGTAGYAAPEQFGFSQSDKRADIYAVGVLVNVMLTGQLPNVKMYSGNIGKVIKKATAIDADNRYQDITELKAAIADPLKKISLHENTMKKYDIIKYIKAIPQILPMVFFNIILLMLDILVRSWVGHNAFVIIFIHIFAAYLFVCLSNHMSKIKSTVRRIILCIFVWVLFIFIYIFVMWCALMLSNLN